MKHDTSTHLPGNRRMCGGLTALQIAKLRRAFGLTLEQAATLAALVYGEGRQ